MRKVIQEYFQFHFHALDKGLEAYRAQQSPGAMHDIRVHIKCLRSVYFLLEYAGHQLEQGHEPGGHHTANTHGTTGTGHPAEAQRLHRQLKKVFRKAGKIRELQVESRWLKQHRKYQLLRVLEYAPAIRRANMDFLQDCDEHFRRHKQMRKKGIRLLKKLKLKDMNAYLSALLNHVLNALNGKTATDEWHALRKCIKRLMHAKDWLMVGKSVGSEVLRFLEDLEKLQVAIGYWHDLQVLEYRLHKAEPLIRSRAIATREAKSAIGRLREDQHKMESEIRMWLTFMHNRWIAGSLRRASSSSAH